MTVYHFHSLIFIEMALEMTILSSTYCSCVTFCLRLSGIPKQICPVHHPSPLVQASVSTPHSSVTELGLYDCLSNCTVSSLKIEVMSYATVYPCLLVFQEVGTGELSNQCVRS